MKRLKMQHPNKFKTSVDANTDLTKWMDVEVTEPMLTDEKFAVRKLGSVVWKHVHLICDKTVAFCDR